MFKSVVPAGTKDTVFSILAEPAKDFVGSFLNFAGQKAVNAVSNLASNFFNKRSRKRRKMSQNLIEPPPANAPLIEPPPEPGVVGTFVSKPEVDAALENIQQVPLVAAAVSESNVEPPLPPPPLDVEPPPYDSYDEADDIKIEPQEIFPPPPADDLPPPAPGVELHSTRNRKVLRCYRCGTFVSRNKPHSIEECNERIRKFKANRGKRKSTASKRKRKVEKELLKSFRALERKNAATVGVATAVAKKARSLIEKYKGKSKIPKQIVNFLKYVDKKIQ